MCDFSYGLYKRFKWTLKSKEYMYGYDEKRFSRIATVLRRLHENGIIADYEFFTLFDMLQAEFDTMSYVNDRPARPGNDRPARYGVYFTI